MFFYIFANNWYCTKLNRKRDHEHENNRQNTAAGADKSLTLSVALGTQHTRETRHGPYLVFYRRKRNVIGTSCSIITNHNIMSSCGQLGMYYTYYFSFRFNFP